MCEQTSCRSVFCCERGLCPRHTCWGEVRNGGGAPLRVLVLGDPGSSAGLAGATIPGGRLRKGGEAPRRVSWELIREKLTRHDRLSSAGFAGAAYSWGEASEGGRSPPPSFPQRARACRRARDGDSMTLVITPALIGQVVISGLLAGSLYAMVALGLGLIFGVMRVLNVAHGPILMLGAYTTFWLFHWLGLNPYLSLLVSMPVLFLVGLALQGTLVGRVVDAPELSSLLLTFGVSIALVNLAQLAFTSDLRSVEYLTGSFVLGPFAFSKSRVIACGFAIFITVAAFLFLKSTRLGKAIRAVSQSREVAQVCGVNVQQIHMIAFGIAAALAAAGGSLVAVMVAIQPEMGQVYTFKSFLVIVLGGAGNYPGALLGGLLLGLVEQLSSLFLTTQVNEAVAYVLLVVILLIRPTGILKGRAS